MSDRGSIRFRKPNRISKHLFCNICNEVLEVPTRLPCGHIFCSKCILQWAEAQKNCPVCRGLFMSKQLQKDLLAMNLVGELEVLCSNPGCEWFGELDSYKAHSSSCAFHPERVEPWLKDKLHSLPSDEEVNTPTTSLFARLNQKYGHILKKAYTSKVPCPQSILDHSDTSPIKRKNLKEASSSKKIKRM